MNPVPPYPAPAVIIQANGTTSDVWLDGISTTADSFVIHTRPRLDDRLPVYSIHYDRGSDRTTIRRLQNPVPDEES